MKSITASPTYSRRFICLTCGRDIVVVTNAKLSDECAKCRTERIFELQLDNQMDDDPLSPAVPANSKPDALSSLAASG
jgi:hypothetical protein